MGLSKKTLWSPFEKYINRVEVPARTVLLEEGKVSKTMFFVEKGCLRTWINHDGKEITTQFFFEGDRYDELQKKYEQTQQSLQLLQAQLRVSK